VPNPANCRIVHNRPRYIDGYTPRVNGNNPGNPNSRPYSTPTESGPYNGSFSTPDNVENTTPDPSRPTPYNPSPQRSVPVPSVVAVRPPRRIEWRRRFGRGSAGSPVRVAG